MTFVLGGSGGQAEENMPPHVAAAYRLIGSGGNPYAIRLGRLLPGLDPGLVALAEGMDAIKRPREIDWLYDIPLKQTAAPGTE